MITPPCCHDDRVALPKEISTLLDNSHDDFPAIISKSSDDDVQRIFRHTFSALQDIDLGDGTDATGLILSKDDHKVANGNQLFNRADGALKAYDPSIQDNDNNVVHLRQEKTWSHKIDCQAFIRTAERVGKKFVLSCVEETWLVCL